MRQMQSPTAATTLTTIPPELLDEIAFHTALPNSKYGPPTDLTSLLLVCRSIHDTLVSSLCLYARLFRAQFDSAALWRRFPQHWLSTQILAGELRRRWKALRRIECAAGRWGKHAQDEPAPADIWSTYSLNTITQDLWLMFLMLLENDGMNEGQLRWAGALIFIKAYLASHLVPRARKFGFQPETVDATLALSISWLLTDQESLISETARHTEAVVGLIRPFVFGAHRYDACFAPWPEFDLPLQPPSPSKSRPRLPARYRIETHTPYMATDQVLRNNGQTVRCLDQQAVISAPVMTASAICCYFARIEVRMSGSRPRLDNGVIPQRATGAGPGPLIARRNGTLAPSTSSFTTNSESGEHAEHYPAMGDSKIYDIDFHRLVACVDPYVASFDGVRPFYPPGTLAGVWEGRFAYLEFDAFRDMLVGYNNPQELVQEHELLTGQQHQIWRTKEFHLYSSGVTDYLRRTPPESYDHALPDADPEDDSSSVILSTGPALNAFFPEKTLLREAHGGLEVYEPGKQGYLFYKEYVPSSTGEVASPPIDADEEEDRILDTIITGSGHSAWGPFSVRGRVRTWDGLLTAVKDYSYSGTGATGPQESDAEDGV
ncbi:hypothetical protein FRB97_007876 [Tulasnella sp. 331]|nr:hypothetical protein FRB97_007876 [Tulasnella sp. 331]KAG8875358.1 hypothetical protein FRB98_007942 [Tulasnella sp. 332]